MKYFTKVAASGFRWIQTLVGLFHLGTILSIAAVDYLWSVKLTRRFPRQARAQWQMRTARRLASPFGLRTKVICGQPPAGGALVCNHLSYLDILVLAAQMPCVFIAKREVSTWPLLGWLTQSAGTLYIDRQHPRDILRVMDMMRAIFTEGLPLVFFPEGTSTDGASVLSFKTSLFEGFRPLGCPILAAAISYDRPRGSVANEVVYWRDMTLLHHILNLLACPGVEACLSFATHPVFANLSDRKALASMMREQVIGLRAGCKLLIITLIISLPNT